MVRLRLHSWCVQKLQVRITDAAEWEFSAVCGVGRG